jgi:putative ABC transport system permease protein
MKKLHLPSLQPKLTLVTLVQAASFILLLLVYLVFKLTVQRIVNWNAFGLWKVGKSRAGVISVGLYVLRLLDIHEPQSISRLELIDLSIRNMQLKKTRSMITIGGMSIGIAVIVFLVSIGYGLQSVVISRIAQLDEMKQADVSVQPGGRLQLDDKALVDFKNIENVDKVLPQISVVGKVSYKSSVSDMAVYGVTADYLNQSAVKVRYGKTFSSNDQTVKASEIPQLATTPVPTPTTDPTVDGGANLSTTTTVTSRSVNLSNAATHQAVVNQAMLQLLGLPQSQAVGQHFSVSFVVSDATTDGTPQKIESVPADYTVIGVVPEATTPYFYVPFIDLRSLGISQFSQVKVVATNQGSLAMVRKHIEVLGYDTQSVVDTVAQVNTLFDTLRTVLLILGLGALLVASLGMFNTLTVSLLERTREVGLMKSMGMRSFEVRELFLTESMIMGLFGGVIGLILGVVSGKILSLVVTILSWSQGGGVIDVSVVPISFGLLIIATSLIVGFLTGLYPSRRATKISALNALRYE